MSEFSPALTLAWRKAASEAVNAKHPFIENGHIFVALCKLPDALNPDFQDKLVEGVDVQHLRAELMSLVGLFTELKIDRKKLRRKLREIMGTGEHEHIERVIHRGEDCKRSFERAAGLAVQAGAREISVFHLLVALMEEPGAHIAEALASLGHEKEGIRHIAEKLGGKPEPIEPARPHFEGPPPAPTPFLERYGRDLTQLAREGRFATVFERRDIALEVMRTLVKNTKNNPVLIGEAGVGKTAVVEALAARIARGNLTPHLRNKRIIALDIGGLVAGTKYRGEFEERMKGVIAEASANSDVILFIDEIHTLMGAGRAEGAPMDAVEIMKPALGRGDITCIGATTIDEYRRYIEKDPALERRFQPVLIAEPDTEQAVRILSGIFEKRKGAVSHEVVVEPSAIRAAVGLSVRYMPQRRLPDKARDVLEQACARATVECVSHYGDGPDLPAGTINSGVVAEVVAEMTGIPVGDLTEGEKERFARMADILKDRIMGQDDAVERVSKVVKKHMAGLKDPNRPVGVFLFVGPTGVGKTELAKALAEFMFGSSREIVRFDMSEFMAAQSVSKLIGAPPGYIGHDAEGQLTGRLRTMPYSLVLLDEIEKAHPEVFDLFLQVFDEGRLTDSKGRTVDARNALFIMTSNAGTESCQKEPMGFGHHEDDGRRAGENIVEALKKTFRPEFLNRIDETIVFNPLRPQDIQFIALKMLDDISGRLENMGIHMVVEDGALDLISKEGYDPVYGARPLRRAIGRLIEEPLSERILKGEFRNDDAIIVDAEEGKIVFGKGRQLVEKKDLWIDTMATAPAGTVYQTIKEDVDIGALVEGHPRDVTIMFTDLKDCVVYFEDRGTQMAADWIEDHNEILVPIIVAHGGIVVKRICDAIVAVFPDPMESVLSAVEMQRTLEGHNMNVDESERYHVRISMNSGRVTKRGGELFGKAINVAARIDKNIAQPMRILIAPGLHGLVKDDTRVKLSLFKEEKFKGLKKPIEVYEVLWKEMG